MGMTDDQRSAFRMFGESAIGRKSLYVFLSEIRHPIETAHLLAAEALGYIEPNGWTRTAYRMTEKGWQAFLDMREERDG